MRTPEEAKRSMQQAYHDFFRPTIVAAEIVITSERYGVAVVMAEFSDGQFQDVAWFYTDEKHYTGREFLSLTLEQAQKKFLRDDQQYLRS